MKFNSQTRIRYKTIRNLIGNVKNKTLLDIGCGGSPISEGVKTLKTIRMDGVQKYNPDISWNFNKYPWPIQDRSIDLIIAGEILEHMFTPIKFLKECNRILKKNGEIIISVPNICSFKNRFKVLFNQLPEGCAFPSDDESYERHIIDFNSASLRKILLESGFRVLNQKSNGIILHSRLIWPVFLTPASFGETLIVKAVKEK